MDWYDAIPKVELHCHVEGSLPPETVLEVARRAGRDLAGAHPEELYRYTSLDAFLAVFWLIQATFEGRADWERVAFRSLVDGATHGLRYREMFFTPARHLASGQTLAGIVDGLTAGILAAEASAGVRCMLIADIDRAYGPAAGRELVEQLAELRRAGRAERVIGVGMDSTELGVDFAAFAEPFDLARRHGFRRTGHAGEAVGVGPENIRIALDRLGVERIDHGVAVTEDPALAERMAAERIPLTVCPTSNVVIANRFEDLREHPFRAMRDAGLLVTVNTDDPGMINLDLGTEYRRVAQAQGFGFDEIAAIALDGIEASWLDDVDRRALRTEFARSLDALRLEIAPEDGPATA